MEAYAPLPPVQRPASAVAPHSRERLANDESKARRAPNYDALVETCKLCGAPLQGLSQEDIRAHLNSCRQR